ncbi:MAG: D-alanyl-D-alanine carboxypeptidase, partial [Paenibacillaceae bacterium]|nr:D-alanyl-D-alanine carboxypeptidase [Paenibacillaceae bacterium]
MDHKTQIETTDELNLYAQSAVLMDASTNRILYGKNEELVRPMASTTKIMTCIIALENGNLSDPVAATQNAANQPKVHLGVYKGETIYLKDLLYSLMLESHNDAAMMIAEHIGGSREGFAKLMNQKAKELGCSNTYFITPNGLDAKEEN